MAIEKVNYLHELAMGNLQDLTGQKFGRLTVLKRAGSTSAGRSLWKCQCDCGVRCTATGKDLLSGNTKSCGCSRRQGIVIDLTGKRFGKWTVIGFVDRKNTRNRIAYWECLCRCGTRKKVLQSSLLNGTSTSCGQCVRRIDLTGRRFGRLKVLGYANSIGNPKRALWKCKCDCGKIKNVRGELLLSGETKSCGCLFNERVLQLKGQKFGRLTVIKRAGLSNSNKLSRLWECRCDCGAIVKVEQGNLQAHIISSCGCLRKELISQVRLTASDYEKLAKRFELIWLGSKPVRSHDKTQWKCKQQGHTFWSNFGNLSYSLGCPKCLDLVNGARISKPQRELKKMIKGGRLNHRFRPYTIDIALFVNGIRIAIEYDSWYNHANRLDLDAMKYEALLVAGWRVLQIKANESIPSQARVLKAIRDLTNGATRRIITMPDWGKGPTRKLRSTTVKK